MKYQYKVDIRWSEEDKAFLARVPELEGVVTHGKTVVEAAQMAEEAIELYLETLNDLGEEAPTPVALRDLPGKCLLRMGKERHEDVFLRAQAEGKSVNDYLNSLIDRDQERPFKLIRSSVKDPSQKYRSRAPVLKRKVTRRKRHV